MGDASGAAYVTGIAFSSDFPTTPGAFQTTYGGGSWDGFITKLNASGNGLIYSTFLGGSDFDGAYGIGLDTSGMVYAAGSTSSANFPVTPGAFTGHTLLGLPAPHPEQPLRGGRMPLLRHLAQRRLQAVVC